MGLKSYLYNNWTYAAPGFDFDGNTRPNPAGSIPDVGAYESIFALPTPDLEIL
jgi:hypothetical protein